MKLLALAIAVGGALLAGNAQAAPVGTVSKMNLQNAIVVGPQTGEAGATQVHYRRHYHRHHRHFRGHRRHFRRGLGHGRYFHGHRYPRHGFRHRGVRQNHFYRGHGHGGHRVYRGHGGIRQHAPRQRVYRNHGHRNHGYRNHGLRIDRHHGGGGYRYPNFYGDMR